MIMTDTDKIINNYYVNIVMNKPNHIEINNSYESYCVYSALEKYASEWQTIWFNKSYIKKMIYAKKNTCKYCFRKNSNAENIVEWEECDYESYFGGDFHYKCETCKNIYADIWKEGEKMFVCKIPNKINIYYEKKKQMRFFKH